MINKRNFDSLLNERTRLLDFVVSEQLEEHSKSVFVIDDCKETLLLLKRYLRDCPEVNVRLYSDEFKALKEAQKNEPQILIVDYNLKIMNGVILSDFLRKLKLEKIPTIIISSDRSVVEEVKNIENAKFLLKPFGKADLRNMMEV